MPTIPSPSGSQATATRAQRDPFRHDHSRRKTRRKITKILHDTLHIHGAQPRAGAVLSC